jgi:hypothetical protein
MSRHPRKQPLARKKLLTRNILAVTTLIFAGCFAAASDDASNSSACCGPGGPTNLDYLVLASIADSPQLFAMAGYRSAAPPAGSSPGAPPGNPAP